MKKNTRFVGLEVHADTIAVAVAEADGEVRSLGTIPNRPEPVRKLLKKLEPTKHLKMCYEAGPTGYALYWEADPAGRGLHRGGSHAGTGEGGRPR